MKDLIVEHKFRPNEYKLVLDVNQTKVGKIASTIPLTEQIYVTNDTNITFSKVVSDIFVGEL